MIERDVIKIKPETGLRVDAFTGVKTLEELVMGLAVGITGSVPCSLDDIEQVIAQECNAVIPKKLKEDLLFPKLSWHYLASVSDCLPIAFFGFHPQDYKAYHYNALGGIVINRIAEHDLIEEGRLAEKQYEIRNIQLHLLGVLDPVDRAVNVGYSVSNGVLSNCCFSATATEVPEAFSIDTLSGKELIFTSMMVSETEEQAKKAMVFRRREGLPGKRYSFDKGSLSRFSADIDEEKEELVIFREIKARTPRKRELFSLPLKLEMNNRGKI